MRDLAAVVAAQLALGRVLSPQFLLWLVPLVPLVAGRRGRLASGLLALALVATHLWFPDLYRDYVNERGAAETAYLLAPQRAAAGRARRARQSPSLAALRSPRSPTAAKRTNAGRDRHRVGRLRPDGQHRHEQHHERSGSRGRSPPTSARGRRTTTATSPTRSHDQSGG